MRRDAWRSGLDREREGKAAQLAKANHQREMRKERSAVMNAREGLPVGLLPVAGRADFPGPCAALSLLITGTLSAVIKISVLFRCICIGSLIMSGQGWAFILGDLGTCQTAVPEEC